MKFNKCRYTPTKLTTSECKILLNIAQFNYQPFETTIVGSGVTDFISDVGEDDADKPVAFGTTKKPKPLLLDQAGADPALTAALAKAKANRPIGAGAVADAGAEHAAQMNRKGAEKAVQRRRAEEQKQQEDQAGPGAECVPERERGRERARESFRGSGRAGGCGGGGGCDAGGGPWRWRWWPWPWPWRWLLLRTT